MPVSELATYKLDAPIPQRAGEAGLQRKGDSWHPFYPSHFTPRGNRSKIHIPNSLPSTLKIDKNPLGLETPGLL